MLTLNSFNFFDLISNLKRLSLKHASYIMMLGWVFATLMATLPLFGVSDYRKFAVCLPFETGDGVSLGYVSYLGWIDDNSKLH